MHIREATGSLTSYHAEWFSWSGMHERGAQAHERSLCELIRLACCVDQLGCTKLACMEHVVRRLVALEVAVERNPRHPDYSGFGAVEGGEVSSRGAAKMAVFCAHMATRQREKAALMKQERLFREERGKRAKVEGGGGGGAASSLSKDGGYGRERGGGRGKHGGGDEDHAATDGQCRGPAGGAKVRGLAVSRGFVERLPPGLIRLGRPVRAPRHLSECMETRSRF